MLYQWATCSSLPGVRQTGSVFCICHISSSPWWPQCVSVALAHKGQIGTTEPGELEHCRKWLPCGHFEHARPSCLMRCPLLSLSRGGTFCSLSLWGSWSCTHREKPSDAQWVLCGSLKRTWKHTVARKHTVFTVYYLFWWWIKICVLLYTGYKNQRYSNKLVCVQSKTLLNN